MLERITCIHESRKEKKEEEENKRKDVKTNHTFSFYFDFLFILNTHSTSILFSHQVKRG